MIKNVLVTGSSGELARYVIPELLKNGYNVTGFDCLLPEGITRRGQKTDYQFIKGDLANLGDCMRAIIHAKADAIIHLGAIRYNSELQPGIKRWQMIPEDETMKVNTMGTYYILDAARRFDVKKFVLASSYCVLGIGFRISNKPFEVEYLPIDERHPLRPEDTYGLSKMLDEEICKAFSRAYGIQAIALRLHLVHFPFNYDNYKYGITPQSTPGHSGGPKDLTHQYVDARDVAQAFVLSLKAEGLDEFEPFFIITDSLYTEDTENLVARLWPDIKDMAVNLKGTEGIISCRKAQEKLGYKPLFSWRNNRELQP